MIRESDIVEKYVKEVKMLREYWDMNIYFQASYGHRITTEIGEMDLMLEYLDEGTHRYEVSVERCKYSPFSNNSRSEKFSNLDDAINYYNILKNKYNGVKVKKKWWNKIIDL